MATGPNQPRPSNRTSATVGISTAADGLGDQINLTGLTLSSIQMSSDWTEARIGFKGSVDGSSVYGTLYTTVGDALTFPTTAGRVLIFDPTTFAGISNLQVMSASSNSTAIVQAAARTLKLGLYTSR